MLNGVASGCKWYHPCSGGMLEVALVVRCVHTKVVLYLNFAPDVPNKTIGLRCAVCLSVHDTVGSIQIPESIITRIIVVELLASQNG